ncbi:hypothetical protein LWI28_006756 [Acer negundo]|uniref:Uncharacterized protein n=1 Tax=Acer negundo TaxID=4023 RepID=A0AAD5JCM6_ACENE|nr:hypothetical protein LWI28_006756 [Acer negundo]
MSESKIESSALLIRRLTEFPTMFLNKKTIFIVLTQSSETCSQIYRPGSKNWTQIFTPTSDVVTLGKRHYANKCPKAKSAKLVCQLEQVANNVPSDADFKSIFSKQEGVDNNTTFILHDSDSASSSDTLEFSNSFILDSYQAIRVDSSSGPHVSIQILSEKFSKPVDAIAYIDTGSHTTMMNPNVLPPTAWKSHFRYLKAVDGQIFTTHLIFKNKIGIKLFPSYTYWTRVIGTPLHDKDILIGWDVYCQCKSLWILPTGIIFKRDFKVFSQVPKIFHLSDIQPLFQQIQHKLLQLCANSHADFIHHSPL